MVFTLEISCTLSLTIQIGLGLLLIAYVRDIAGEKIDYNVSSSDFDIQNISITDLSTAKPLDIDIVDKFLQLVETERADSCKPGTEFTLGQGVVQQYGKIRFRTQADIAVNRANLLTQIWKLEPDNINFNESFFYSQVVNLVQSDEDIFAAGNCYDEYEFKGYQLFCPYAYRQLPSGVIMVKDLSIEYEYLGSTSEWFYNVKQTAETLLLNRSETMMQKKYRGKDTDGKPIHGQISNDSTILVTYNDGHWSMPYFDCGGGNIWMMTYTVPFFGYSDGVFKFKGTSGIDIDLQKVDIDQCVLPPGSTETNIFANSSKCHYRTTMCEPVRGLGFRRGSYKCVCRPGFYFPDTSLPADQRHYNGSYTEEQYSLNRQGFSNVYHTLKCLQCAKGCDTCEDSSPCFITLNWILRGCLLAASSLIMCVIPAIAFFVWKYKDVKVLKAASPKLLVLILVGAVFLYCPMIVMYFEATEVTCSLKLWFRELGFSISYGALLLKTWRISMVFRVRSATRIKITDSGLIRRLFIIVAVFAAFLIARMIWGRPRVVVGVHRDGLKAMQCSFDVWDYCQAAAELCLLIWGIRLCIVVRKAPSEFNESKFISWAIYNETLLSIFLNLALLFLQSPANPDLLYIVHFIHTNLTTTVTLVFLFISKAYLVYKLIKKGDNRTQTRANSQFKYTKSTHNGTADTAESLIASDTRNSIQWKDMEDELKRVYGELEKMKQSKMKENNPHIKNNRGAQLSRKSSFLNFRNLSSTTSQQKLESRKNYNNNHINKMASETSNSISAILQSKTELIQSDCGITSAANGSAMANYKPRKGKQLAMAAKHNIFISLDEMTDATTV